jgi:hypothetical protein
MRTNIDHAIYTKLLEESTLVVITLSGVIDGYRSRIAEELS